MRLEHHLVGGYVRYISPHIIIIIIIWISRCNIISSENTDTLIDFNILDTKPERVNPDGIQTTQ